jgi:hypothetical protein
VGTTDLEHIPVEVLDVAGIAAYLCVSESIIRRLIREQKIPCNRIEGRIVFFLPAIREWLTKTTIQPNDGSSDSTTKEATRMQVSNIWKHVEKGK